MPSKSNSTDKTANTTKTNVVDRRVVQERGNQILDSVIYSNDDKVIRAAMGEARSMLANLSNASTVTVTQMDKTLARVLEFANKGQVQMNQFGLTALEAARRELRDLSDKGQVMLELADETVGQAMTMAQRVAQDQARNQNTALEILKDAKTGDYSDLTMTITGMMMATLLGALFIMKRA